MRVLIPNPGFNHNPIMKFPRNAQCFCGADKKFKKCHLSLTNPFAEQRVVDMLEEFLPMIKAGTFRAQKDTREVKNEKKA